MENSVFIGNVKTFGSKHLVEASKRVLAKDNHCVGVTQRRVLKISLFNLTIAVSIAVERSFSKLKLIVYLRASMG